MSAAGSNAISGSRWQFWIGSTLFEVSGVKLSDKLNTEVTRRLGSQAIAARTEGEYETDQITGQCEVAVFFFDVLPQLPANGFGNFRFDGMGYADHPQIGAISVQAKECSFAGLSADIKAEPGATMMDITINVNQLVWQGKTLERVAGAAGGVGPSAPIGFSANISGAVGLAGGFVF